MSLRITLRLHRVCNPPYRFKVGPVTYEYDPLLKTTMIVGKQRLTEQNWRKEADGWHNRKNTSST